MTSYPQEFMCPITQDLMLSPVICRDGITYEESAIRQWLQFHNTSPVTREHLSELDLIPNRALKYTIEEYLKKNQIRINNSSNIVSSTNDNIITLTNEVTGNIIDGKYYVNIKVKPTIQQRKGISLIVLLDISGSMGQSVSENINGETDGFTRLDLIKHTMRTIIESLSDNDELCVIKFNSVATKVCSFIKMTQVNKLDINSKLDMLYADGQTNIWDALRLAFDTIKTIDTNNRVGSIFLLTDGESNVNPPRGIVETLKTTYDFSKLQFTVNTFGYSYNVDSSLLYQISSLFGGIYGFIPDGTMVGTIFINAISNLLSSVSSSCKLKIESTNFKLCTNTNLGFMPNNQEKNILIEYSDKTDINGNVVIVFDNKSYTIPLHYHESPNVNVSFAKIVVINICKSINQTLIYSSNFITNLDKTKDYITKLYLTDSFISDLIDDLNNEDPNRGQLKKSIQCADWYNKWGKHYLPSAIRSHELELCFNFKDAAPQHYAGDTFKTEQARIESIFCTIAPPRPTLRATIQTQNMTSYYNQSGGCFSGNGNVLMADSTTKLVKEIKKGDKIKTLYGDSIIKCVIKLTYNKIIPISKINNLEITPFHPIYYENEWKFPQEIVDSSNSFVTELYDFVLDSHHIVNINNVNVVCLGHNIKEQCVEHEYFGNHIIEDLENMSGWTEGYINLENFSFVRDPITNLVIKLYSKTQ